MLVFLRKICFEELSCGWPLSSCHVDVLIKILPDLPGFLEMVTCCGLGYIGWAAAMFPSPTQG